MTGGPSASRPPRVTVGLLVYNEADHVRQAIASVLKQPFTDFELVIGDNASTDGSSAIIAELAAGDSRIVHVRRECNIGALSNLNDVLWRARGEYFVLAGGHDLWSEDFLGALVAALDSTPTAVLAFAQTQWIDADGSHVDTPTSIVATGGMSRIGRFVALMQTNQHYLYGMMRTASARRAGRQRHVIGSGELFLQSLAQLGDFVLVQGERWFRRRVREDGGPIARLNRYRRALFRTDAQRRRMGWFPHLQMMLLYCALPFTMPDVPLPQRLCMTLAYPLIWLRFARLLPVDIAWLFRC